jgi:hypothetical protein
VRSAIETPPEPESVFEPAPLMTEPAPPVEAPAEVPAEVLSTDEQAQLSTSEIAQN